MKVVQHPGVFQMLFPDGLLQQGLFIAVTGKEEEHIPVIPHLADRIQNGIHILNGAHIAKIGHHEFVF